MPAPISALRDFQFRLEYVALRAIVGLVRAVPLDAASSISGRAWRFLAPKISRKRHTRALDNLAIAFPEKPLAEREKIALANWENLGPPVLAGSLVYALPRPGCSQKTMMECVGWGLPDL